MPLTLTEAISDSVDVTDSLAGQLIFSRALNDTVGITDVLTRAAMPHARTFTNTVEITDVVAGRIVFASRVLNDTVGITDTMTRVAGHPRSFTDTVGITNTMTIIARHPRAIADTVGISGHLKLFPSAALADTVGITDTLVVTGVFVQFDTWRPVPKPGGNNLILVCRTPESTHDTPTGLEGLSFWTLLPDGSNERPALWDPTINGYGWLRQSHPEWSPDGNQIVFLVETTNEYKLIVLNSSWFGN